ncbi:MAG: U32 family peptidase [Candidatus Omnitrophica bacterium]|nr:U32 family peptidase [Candidatus Omnitrophota bacterium]
MKLTVPFNGDCSLIASVAEFSEVKELYGKLPADDIGGGKHSFQLPFISKKRLAHAVTQAHGCGIEFNYLLNSTCLDNAEWTRRGQKRITRLLDWLVGIKVDSVTVATPYLLELIKKRYPHLNICVSDLAYVNTARRAKYWQDLGAGRITLFNVDLNRDFSTLKQIRKDVRCELKLIVNVNCLHNCPFYIYHANIASHASQSGHVSRGFVIDYCRIRCRYQQLAEPVNFIRSTWIRPEDTGYYETIGIDWFKIIDRGMTTSTILSIVDAYVKRTYDGNLLDLFPDPSKSILFKKMNVFRTLKYFLRPGSVNIFKLKKFKGLIGNPVYIENKKLDGFLAGIIEKQCSKQVCEDCGYCFEVMAKVGEIDDERLADLKMKYRRCVDEMISGKLYRYF